MWLSWDNPWSRADKRGQGTEGRYRKSDPQEASLRGRPDRAFLSGRGQEVIVAQTKDALRILRSVTGNNEAVKAGIAQAKINFEVAQIYDARTKAGLSQSELAELIGSKQPVIARLEDADYEGRSLTMLQRIAAALARGAR
jgi:hypothetical protein